jgi:hypothetical protein
MIDRLDELNRVLTAVHSLNGHRESPVTLTDVVELCASTVQSGLLPDHELTAQFAEQLMFVESNAEGLWITEQGVDFLQLNPQKYYSLTEGQRQVLTRNHYFGRSFGTDCKQLLTRFNFSSESGLLTWSEVDDSTLDCPMWVASHLVQLGVLRLTECGYETTAEMAPVALEFREEPKGLTEAKMEAMLLEKKLVGDVGEKLAMRFEKERLAGIGAHVESHCVRRIGNVRLNAGYDLESFDAQSATMVYERFIEVKAAKGKDLRFFWTENEMSVANKLRDRYWIYFLGGVDPVGATATYRPLMFQDPVRSVLEDARLEKVSQGFIVESKMRGEKW